MNRFLHNLSEHVAMAFFLFFLFTTRTVVCLCLTKSASPPRGRRRSASGPWCPRPWRRRLRRPMRQTSSCSATTWGNTWRASGGTSGRRAWRGRPAAIYEEHFFVQVQSVLSSVALQFPEAMAYIGANFLCISTMFYGDETGDENKLFNLWKLIWLVIFSIFLFCVCVWPSDVPVGNPVRRRSGGVGLLARATPVRAVLGHLRAVPEPGAVGLAGQGAVGPAAARTGLLWTPGVRGGGEGGNKNRRRVSSRSKWLARRYYNMYITTQPIFVSLGARSRWRQ